MPTRSLPRHRSHAATLTVALAFLTPPAARADCIDDAAARHRVNAEVLRAIGWQESRLRPQALGHNANDSLDVGAFQINSVHLSELGRYGIDRAALADGCTSAEVAAWHYRRQVDRRGNSWQAVGAYHSATPERAAWYANQVAAILMRWNVLPNGALPFPVEGTLAPDGPAAMAKRSHAGGASASLRSLSSLISLGSSGAPGSRGSPGPPGPPGSLGSAVSRSSRASPESIASHTPPASSASLKSPASPAPPTTPASPVSTAPYVSAADAHGASYIELAYLPTAH